MITIEATSIESPEIRELSVGNELVLRCPENPTTGFRWQITYEGKDNIQVVEDTYEPTNIVSQPGAGGQRVFHLVARKPGIAQLMIELCRSWEPKPAIKKQLTIVIR
ncbi:MAG: protease inhibitor I42 family protein [Nitrosomonas sp.]|nr:protease inhibitor I42 family protein [Nitrosomonas sp.]